MLTVLVFLLLVVFMLVVVVVVVIVVVVVVVVVAVLSCHATLRYCCWGRNSMNVLGDDLLGFSVG